MRRSVLSAFLPLLLSGLAMPAAVAADASVASRLDARGLKYEVDEDGDYKVTYNYAEENRTQLVFVSGGTESVGGFSVREVFAPAGHVQQDRIDGARAIALLEDNATNKLGAWEIRGNYLNYVIKLPDSIDAAQLETAMDIAAQMADDKEIEFSGDKDEL